MVYGIENLHVFPGRPLHRSPLKWDMELLLKDLSGWFRWSLRSKTYKEVHMAGLKSLNAAGLPESFDLGHHGDKPIIEMTYTDDTIRLSYIFPGYRLSHAPGKSKTAPGDRDAFHNEVGITGTGFLSASGKPLLPSLGRFVQIPPGHHYTVKVKKGPFHRRRNMRVKPAQENAADQGEWVLEFDDEVYRQDQFYPQELVAVSEPLFMDGYRVLCLHVRPFQYNPVRELLRCYSNIEVAIKLQREDLTAGWRETTSGEVPQKTYLGHTGNLEGFGNFLFNPERQFFGRRAPAVPRREAPAGGAAIPEYLIIYGADLEKPARKLQAWKQKLGLDTAIVPVADIIAPDDGKPTARIQRLKNHIRTQRRALHSPLRYVLLLGDITRIPTEERRRPGEMDPPQFDTTDFYYFTHRDAQGEECLLPWVAGGRIPAQTEAEGLSVVDQIIRYEKDPPRDPDYYGRMTVAAYFEDRDKKGRQDGRADKAYLKTMESIRRHMIIHGFEVHRVYETNNLNPTRYADGTPVPLEVRQALIHKRHGRMATKMLIDRFNAGQLIVGHRGHGDRGGWRNPSLKTEDLARVSSSNPSILFSINCRSGSFDGGRVCLAEEILALNGGAPSLIAATERSGAWRNDSMIKALYDAVWPGIIPTYPVTTMRLPVKYSRMGDILNYAKAYLLTAHGLNANTRKHFEIYHVVGDPTLQIWGSRPLALRLRTRLKAETMMVTLNTCPQDAVLSVWYAERCLLTLKPSGTRLGIRLRLLKGLPQETLNPQREQTVNLTLYFAAPGHRLATSELWF